MSNSILKGLVCTGATCALFGIILAGQPCVAEEQSGSFDFNVTVNKTLEVSVKGDDGQYKPDTTISSEAGGIGEFLRTSFTLKVSTNNANGFKATMTTVGAETGLTNLLDSTYTILNLANNTTRGAFTTNRWGFSLDDTEDGDENSNYKPLIAAGETGSLVAYSNAPVADATKDIYFGMKADATKIAGNYRNTVVLTVVTNAAPVEPTEDEENTEVDVPDNTNPSQAPARMMARSVVPSNDEEEDNTPSGEKPLGVTKDTTSERNEKIIDSSKVGAGIALGVTTIAASGVIFFVVAKRREDDDEEEE